MELGFDSLVFLLTITRTVFMHYHRRKEFQRAGGWGNGFKFRGWTLLDSLVKDGVLYFA
jgi:hypothetical protein